MVYLYSTIKMMHGPIYFGFVRYLRKKGNTMRQCIEFKEAYDSVRWEILYNILTEFGIPMKW